MTEFISYFFCLVIGFLSAKIIEHGRISERIKFIKERMIQVDTLIEKRKQGTITSDERLELLKLVNNLKGELEVLQILDKIL